jgi:RNA polymerase sigma factor (sigma-70 family)
LWRWERDRRQPTRLLYLLKQPRTWFEFYCFMKLLAWVLSKPKPDGAIQILWENTSKSVNCVSDEATARSKENDKRGTPKRQRVVFLSREEELDLARQAKAGDVPARNRLFVTHWPLVASIAQKHDSPRAPAEDLIQEAYGGVNGDGSPVGLVYALGKFDPEKGIRFSTFVKSAIEWAIIDYEKRQPAEMPALDAAIIENAVDLGAHDETEGRAQKTFSRRTSRSIRNRVVHGAITVHISPYKNGLATGNAGLRRRTQCRGLAAQYRGYVRRPSEQDRGHGRHPPCSQLHDKPGGLVPAPRGEGQVLWWRRMGPADGQFTMAEGAAQACQKKTQINRRTLSAFRAYILIGRTQ